MEKMPDKSLPGEWKLVINLLDYSKRFSPLLKGYVQKAILNGEELNSFFFQASKLLKGGSLILEMGPEPNRTWGTAE